MTSDIQESVIYWTNQTEFDRAGTNYFPFESMFVTNATT